mgnify:FL=1
MADRKLTKNDLIESVYLKTKVDKQCVQLVVDSIFEQLKISLQSGKKIELRGFGTFENRMRKGRSKARNPKTGEIVSVDPHFVSVFRPGKEIKQAVWNLPVEVEEE